MFKSKEEKENNKLQQEKQELECYKHMWDDLKKLIIDELKGVQYFDSDFFYQMVKLEQKYKIKGSDE